jgi:hypothetical protein
LKEELSAQLIEDQADAAPESEQNPEQNPKQNAEDKE